MRAKNAIKNSKPRSVRGEKRRPSTKSAPRKVRAKNLSEQPAPSTTIDTAENTNPARLKIMKVATTLFAEKGLEGTSTRDVASAAQLNVSLITYYFGGKDGLYKEILKEYAIGAQATMQKIFDVGSLSNLTKERFIDLMNLVTYFIIKYKSENPLVEQIMRREILAGLPYARESFLQVTQLGEGIVNIFSHGQKAGIVRSDIDPYVWLMLVVHGMDPFFMISKCETPISEKCPRLPEEVDLLHEKLCQIFIQGVLV